MSSWFIYLLTHKTNNKLEKLPLEFQVKTVAEIFRDGATIEAALLQEFFDPNFLPSEFDSKYSVQIFAPQTKIEEAKKTLRDLPLGVYNMSMDNAEHNKGGHNIVFIKGANFIYFWDPNLGLIKEESTNCEEKILKRYNQICRDLGWTNDDKLSISLNLIDDPKIKYATTLTEKYPGIFVSKPMMLSQYVPTWFRKVKRFMWSLITKPFIPVMFVTALFYSIIKYFKAGNRLPLWAVFLREFFVIIRYIDPTLSLSTYTHGRTDWRLLK